MFGQFLQLIAAPLKRVSEFAYISEKVVSMT